MIFPSFYCGPVMYYASLIKSESIRFEAMENFVKQTPRNRMTIDSPNGAVTLTLPVAKTGGKILMKDAEINFSANELSRHWQALQSTYGKSPFFDFYNYLFKPIFDDPPQKLIDFNSQLHQIIMRCLDQEQSIGYTSHYESVSYDEDPRVRFNVKQHNFIGHQPDYRQVFRAKNGFLKNLSILDLLFNMGSESRVYLLRLNEVLNEDG